MHDDPDCGRILSDLRLKPVRLFPSLSHIFPIQTPILDRLGEVLLADALAPLQVGNGPGNLKDAGEGAGGEAESVGDQLQHSVAGGVQFAVLPEVASVHLGVAVDLRPLEPVDLDVTGTFHPAGDGRGTFRLAPVGQVAVADRRDLDVDVDPVEERPGDPGAVALEHDRGAGALVGDVPQVAAGTGVCTPFSTIPIQNGTRFQSIFPLKNSSFPVIPPIP